MVFQPKSRWRKLSQFRTSCWKLPALSSGGSSKSNRESPGPGTQGPLLSIYLAIPTVLLDPGHSRPPQATAPMTSAAQGLHPSSPLTTVHCEPPLVPPLRVKRQRWMALGPFPHPKEAEFPVMTLIMDRKVGIVTL